MLHIRALRGFQPQGLIVDTRGHIPLLGDEIRNFHFYWETKFQKTELSEQQKLFAIWCTKNVSIIGRTMLVLARWKDAIACFERECNEARADRYANFKLEELWKVDLTYAEHVNAEKHQVLV